MSLNDEKQTFKKAIFYVKSVRHVGHLIFNFSTNENSVSKIDNQSKTD